MKEQNWENKKQFTRQLNRNKLNKENRTTKKENENENKTKR